MRCLELTTANVQCPRPVLAPRKLCTGKSSAAVLLNNIATCSRALGRQKAMFPLKGCFVIPFLLQAVVLSRVDAGTDVGVSVYQEALQTIRQALVSSFLWSYAFGFYMSRTESENAATRRCIESCAKGEERTSQVPSGSSPG